MKTLLNIAAVLFIALAAKAADYSFNVTEPKDAARVAALNKEILDRLHTIKVHKFEFKDAPATEVFYRLQQEINPSSIISSSGEVIRFAFDINTLVSTRGENDSLEPGPLFNLPLTLSLSDISVGEALQYVVNLANLRAKIENGKIAIEILWWD